MADGTLTPEYRHEPVMLSEVLESLALRSGSTVLDCTLGGAGHSTRMAQKVGSEGLLIGIDQDDMALEAAGRALDAAAPETPRKLLKGNFGDLDELLCRAEVPGVDGVLFDLGVSSPQLDIPGRGFSYHEDAPLDMRMDPGNNTLNAAEVINTYDEADLARILRVYGEEKFASQIAREICRRREREPIETTLQLVDAIKAGIPAAARRPPSGPQELPGDPDRGQPRARRARAGTRSGDSLAEPRGAHLRHLVPLARGPHREAALPEAQPRVHVPAGHPGVRVRKRAGTQGHNPKTARCERR